MKDTLSYPALPSTLRVSASATWLLILVALAGSVLTVSGCSPGRGRKDATPTPVGTWQMVIEGEVHDLTTGAPIPGAAVRYEVVHSYFPEIQDGWDQATVSDPAGQFRLAMIVHDTDNIRLVVAAPGYTAYEEKLDLLGDRSFSIGLTPE